MKKFIFFITEKDGRCRAVINGVVTSTTDLIPLPQAPDGNQEISIGWERSLIYHSNVRNYGLLFGYVFDGLKILRNDYYKFNLDRELFLSVKRLTYEWTATTFKEYYKQYYKGQIDFATAEDDQGSKRFNVGLLDGDLQRKVKSNEGTVFEIPFDMDAKNVNMDGLFIKGQFKWFVSPYATIVGGYPGLFQLGNADKIPGLAVFDVQMHEEPSITEPEATTLDYFAETTQDIANVHITGLLADFNSLGSSGPLSVILYVFNMPTNTLRLSINLTPDDPYPENYNLLIDQTIDLEEGDRLFLRSNSHFEGEGSLQIDAKSKPEHSVIRGFTVYDLGRKLAEKITGSADNFVSPFLELKNVILSSGDGIRALDNAAIKTNWRDYVKFIDVQFKVSVDITDKIYVNERLTAYMPESSANPAIELGEVRDLKVTPAIELMGTSVKVGHAEQQVDDINGKFDYNGWMVFKLPVTGIPDKQIDLQSPYKASPFEIELVRANFENRTTTDRETDNDVYALAVVPLDSNIFITTATFRADGTPFTPGRPLLSITAGSPVMRPGMKLRITDSTLNSKDVTIKAVGMWFFGQLIETNEALIDESNSLITIEIVEGQYYDLDRSIPVEQLLSPEDADDETKATLYNIPLSPKRILELHKDWLAGGLVNYAPLSVIFSSANRNKELIAGGITEKADISVANLGLPMFKPHWFKFITKTPIDLPLTMDENRNPVVAFIWEGVRYTMFLFKAGMSLNDLEEQEFTGLACPENDLVNLI